MRPSLCHVTALSVAPRHLSHAFNLLEFAEL